MPDILKEEYLDMYKGIQSEILSTTKFDENSDLSTTYLGKADTLNSAYNKVAFNEKSAITKENVCTKYTPYTYKYVALNEKLPIMKQNLCIFFFIIGRVECRSKNNKIKTEESFPISEQGYTMGKLFMSKSYYMHCKSLHSVPKFTSNTQRI